MDSAAVIRIVVVYDQSTACQDFGAMLDAQPDIAVIASASDGDEVIDLVKWTRPNAVLMDIRMPRIDGHAATLAIHAMSVRACSCSRF